VSARRSLGTTTHLLVQRKNSHVTRKSRKGGHRAEGEKGEGAVSGGKPRPIAASPKSQLRETRPLLYIPRCEALMQASALPSAPLLARAPFLVVVSSSRPSESFLASPASSSPSPPGCSGCARQRPNVNPPLGGWRPLVALSSRSRPFYSCAGADITDGQLNQALL